MAQTSPGNVNRVSFVGDDASAVDCLLSGQKSSIEFEEIVVE